MMNTLIIIIIIITTITIIIIIIIITIFIITIIIIIIIITIFIITIIIIIIIINSTQLKPADHLEDDRGVSVSGVLVPVENRSGEEMTGRDGPGRSLRWLSKTRRTSRNPCTDKNHKMSKPLYHRKVKEGNACRTHILPVLLTPAR